MKVPRGDLRCIAHPVGYATCFRFRAMMSERPGRPSGVATCNNQLRARKVRLRDRPLPGAGVLLCPEYPSALERSTLEIAALLEGETSIPEIARLVSLRHPGSHPLVIAHAVLRVVDELERGARLE